MALLEEPFGFGLIGKIIDGFTVADTAVGPRRLAVLRRQASGGDHTLHLAYVYAYTAGEVVDRLPQPLIFIVAGPGEPTPKAAQRVYPTGEFALWPVDPRDDGIAFAIDIGPYADLLDGGGVAGDDATAEADFPADGGATLFRGPDGRVYCVPSSLEAFEVIDEELRSQLELAGGNEIGSFSVKTLAGRGAVAARGASATRDRGRLC